MSIEDRSGRERQLAAVLVGGAAFLLGELRFEHREVLGETWRSWIPLAWSVITLLAGSIALRRWHGRGRSALAVLFGAGVAVGLLGFWFHSGGHPFGAVRDVLLAWRVPPGQDGGIRIGSRPPALAPLAFSGLGLLGLLVCAGRGRAGITD